jgi:hypothetical protein
METSLNADDAIKEVAKILSVLTSGHGKLTDPNRTPNRKVLVPALNELIQVSKGMEPKDRKELLAQLRQWHKTARAHSKRIYQAAYSSRVGDVGMDDIYPARGIRDLIGDAVKIISKFRGGGLGKAQTKAKPGTGKKRPRKKSKSGIPSVMDVLLKDPKEILKQQQAAAAARAGGKTVPSGTVESFIRVLEAIMYKEGMIERSDIKKRAQAVRKYMKADLNSDEKQDLKDLIKVVKRVFSVRIAGTQMMSDGTEDWIGQVEDFIRSGRFPKAPTGTMVVPRRDKRQMAMKFEAMERLRLALAG